MFSPDVACIQEQSQSFVSAIGLDTDLQRRVHERLLAYQRLDWKGDRTRETT